MKPAVLILTHPADVHADAVQAHLDAAGVEVRRIDAPDLSTWTSATASVHVCHDVVTGDVAGIALDRIVGVWHRRPSDFTAGAAGGVGSAARRLDRQADTALDSESARVAATDGAELRAGVAGILAGLPHLNHPADMAVAGFKPHQLIAAARCGLMVPETVITNVLPVAATFADRHADAVVVKPMSRAVVGPVREGDRAGWQRVIHLTQQRIDTRQHIRLTVVDGATFAARITSPHLDWREDADACHYEVVDTPNDIAVPVRKLLRRMRLRYAALDFAEDADGFWWFLEANPNGQWLWIEQATGLPIAAAVAAALSDYTASD